MRLSWYRIVVCLFGPLVRHRVRAAVIGELPKDGPFIVAIAPHKTEAESIVLPAWLTRWRFRFYAKAEYWKGGGVKGRLLRRFMLAMGHIPIDRKNPREAANAVTVGAEMLRLGNVLAVYPEGTRSPEDDITVHAAYPGTVKTLLRAIRDEYKKTGVVLNIPIIPVGLVGMESASSPNGGFWPQRCRGVKIVIGEPIRLSKAEVVLVVQGSGPMQALVNKLSLEMMTSIADLIGRLYDPQKLPIPGN